MKRKLLFSLVLISLNGFGQSAKFAVYPYLNGTASVKDGLIEVGPEFVINKSAPWTVRTTIRLPLTTKTDNVVQIDRFTSTGRGILSAQKSFFNVPENGPIAVTTYAFQAELGITEFKYYPTGQKSSEKMETQQSYGFEGKFLRYYTRGVPNSAQVALNFRLRYSFDWRAANEVGVVNPPNGNGVITTTPVVLDKPSVKPTFSPAIAFQIYPGTDAAFSYAPVLYYDFTGTGKNGDGSYGNKDPFNNLQRLRVEAWVFYFPTIKDPLGVKIGVAPFVSWRIAGTDSFNAVEWGGMLTVKFGSTFQQFF